MVTQKEYMSIRETSKYIYPFIRPGTIFSWMTAGVFRPEIYVGPPAGRGQGCKLSHSDLVTVGILHSLFGLGIKFKDLFRTGIFDFTFADGLQYVTNIWKEIEGQRPVQRQIEGYEYSVHICYEVVRPLDLGIPSDRGEPKTYCVEGAGEEPALDSQTSIRFFPSDALNEHLTKIRDQLRYEIVGFINVQHWNQYVVRRRKLVG